MGNGVGISNSSRAVWPRRRKYRDFARAIGDTETVHRILALTAKLKQRALALSRPSENCIRRRARQIWEQNGRPSGRDEEFWLQAERELREVEELAKRIDVEK